MSVRAGGGAKTEPAPGKSTRILRSMQRGNPPSPYQPITTSQFTEAWCSGEWFTPERLEQAKNPGNRPLYSSNFLLYDKAWMDVTTLCMWLERRLSINPDYDYVDPSNFQSSQAEQRVRRALRTKTHVLFPVISGQNHWIVMKFTEKHVLFYDPKQNPPKPDVEQFLKLFPDMSVEYLVGRAVPKQTDGHSCGIFCCLLMLGMLQNKDWTRSQARKDVQTFRRKCREELETGFELRPEPPQNSRKKRTTDNNHPSVTVSIVNTRPLSLEDIYVPSPTTAPSTSASVAPAPVTATSVSSGCSSLHGLSLDFPEYEDSVQRLDDSSSPSTIELPRGSNNGSVLANSISNRSDCFVIGGQNAMNEAAVLYEHKTLSRRRENVFQYSRVY